MSTPMSVIKRVRVRGGETDGEKNALERLT